MKQVRLALVGLGAVGSRVLRLLGEYDGTFRKRYGLEFSVHCVVDSSGVAVSEEGFDPDRLVGHKARGSKLSELPEFRDGLGVGEALEVASCDMLLEASPVDLDTGEPGISNSRVALKGGLHLVLANKAPLVLAHEELDGIAAASGVGMLYSATFCGGLPVLNVVRRDMVCGDILGFRGIFNGTTNFMLEEMLNGRAYSDALREAQDIGVAEADPSLDVAGWDTAAKLVIAANTIRDTWITLADVEVRGIEDVQMEQLQQCREDGSVLKLLGTAERIDSEWSFRVEPTLLPIGSFLGGCTGWEMAVEVESDVFGTTSHKLYEREPVPTAASMIRDAVHLAVMGRQAAL